MKAPPSGRNAARLMLSARAEAGAAGPLIRRGWSLLNASVNFAFLCARLSSVELEHVPALGDRERLRMASDQTASLIHDAATLSHDDLCCGKSKITLMHNRHGQADKAKLRLSRMAVACARMREEEEKEMRSA